jgi:hypothetical protein
MKPILFSTAMVQAILAGRKTQTRRTKGLDIINDAIDSVHPPYHVISADGENRKGVFFDLKQQDKFGVFRAYPYGNVGDMLWVRETWRPKSHNMPTGWPYEYKADDDMPDGFKWKPSIHMPKEAARLFLKITAIEIERLHDISEEDAIAEGVEPQTFKSNVLKPFDGYKNYFVQDIEDGTPLRTAKASFGSLWQAINGVESFDQNPYVWVIKFEVLNEKPAENA